MKIVEFPYQDLIVDLPQEEDPILKAIHTGKTARSRIRDSVLKALDDDVIDTSLFSGFEGTCIEDGVYKPVAQHIGRGVIYAVTGQEWRIHRGISPEHYAYMKGRNEVPAVGVYDADSYQKGHNRVEWQVINGLSVPETCSQVFMWTGREDD